MDGDFDFSDIKADAGKANGSGGGGGGGGKWDGWTPITPGIAGAPPPPEWLLHRAPEGYRYLEHYEYPDWDRNIFAAAVRYISTAPVEPGEKPKKTFRHFIPRVGPNGEIKWGGGAHAVPRPLFGLHILADRPGAPVLILEGEKKVNAAVQRVPDFAAVSPPNGAQSPDKADWSPLAGLIACVMPDNDPAGEQFVRAAARGAYAAGAAEVRRVRLPDGLPPKWDIADPLPDGFTEADLRSWLEAAEPVEPEVEAKPRGNGATGAGGLWPFRFSPKGVEKLVEHVDRSTGEVRAEWRWFCSSLEVVAVTRNDNSEDWGRLLRLTDRDGLEKEWSMPMAMLAGDGAEYRQQLLSLGLVLAPGKFAREALHEYISTAPVEARARCVSRGGWHGGTFLLGGEPFGEQTEERIILQTGVRIEHAFNESGTLAEWQATIGRWAVGNSRLMLAISAALAAPLLAPTGSEGGGFHFKGNSSIGKSSALHAGGSVWGGSDKPDGYLRTWRATANGLEGVAALHCDALLALDELSQVDPRDAGAAAYMLANGSGKARASRNGMARPPAEWRLIFLSSGEVSLADKMAEDGRGRRIAAGQEVRMINLPADAEAGFGLFETIHGFPSADAFADAIRAAAKAHYGTTIRAWLQSVTADPDSIAASVKQHTDLFMRLNCPPGADGQVRRVAMRFGLVAAAGEMAIQVGVVPWKGGEARWAAGKCFSDWLRARGGAGAAEETDAIARLRLFIEQHGSSRFEAIGDMAPTDMAGMPIDQRIINRAGFRRRLPDGGVEYLILPEVWKSEIFAGFDATAAAKALLRFGFLAVGSEGVPQVKTRLPGFASTVRCYVVTPALFNDAGQSAEQDEGMEF